MSVGIISQYRRQGVSVGNIIRRETVHGSEIGANDDLVDLIAEHRRSRKLGVEEPKEHGGTNLQLVVSPPTIAAQSLRELCLKALPINGLRQFFRPQS